MTVFLWTRTLCTAAKIMKYEKPAQEGCPEIKTKHHNRQACLRPDGLLNVNILHTQNTRILHQRYLMDTLKNKGPVMEYGRGNILK